MPGRKSFKSIDDAVEYMSENKLHGNIVALPPDSDHGEITDEEDGVDDMLHHFSGEVEIEFSDDDGQQEETTASG